jgi:hypothetical protein
MRKVIWTCVAVLVAGAAWMYMAACYVAHRPNSYLSECAVVAYRMSTDLNPMYRVSEACAVKLRNIVHDMISGTACHTEAVADAACYSGGCVEGVAQAVAVEEPTPPTYDRVNIDEQPKLNASWISADAEYRTQLVPVAYEESEAPETKPSDKSDDAEGAPKVMPILPEDEAKPEEPPATMPYLEDEDEDRAVFEFWKSLFVGDDADVAEKKTSVNSGSEEAEAGAEGSPQIDTYEEMPYSCQADDDFSKISEQFYNTAKYATALRLFNRNHPKATAALNEESPSLAGETVYIPPTRILEKFYGSSIQEQMPASHYSSHPSNPGCVVCPYTGKCYPSNPQDDMPATTKPKKKKKKDANGDEGAQAGQPASGSNVSRLIEEAKSTEDAPVQTELDTTEYRKSDAKPGEFDPMPE